MAPESDDKVVVVKGGRVLTPTSVINDGAILIRGRKIAFVGPASDLPEPRGNCCGDCLEIDASGKWIVPGFVDIHIHGAHGADTMDGTYEALNEMSKFLPAYGTTAFLPTTVTADQASLCRAARAVAEAAETGTEGADISGMHLEGPFINVNRKGAQNPEYVRLPNISELEEIIDASGNRVRLVTLAPELPGTVEVIDWLFGRGVTVSVGHSDAKFEEVLEAVGHGLTHGTHTFNGMSGFHHRDPGTAGAILALDDIDAEIIADMVHLHPATIKVIWASKGAGRVILVTDAISATGLPDGNYQLGGLAVIVAKGVARLREGNLAGSTLTMMQAVKNLVNNVGVWLGDAVRAATINPARAVGLDHRKGSLAVGKDGDVVVLDDELNVHTTLVGGRVVFESHHG